MDLRKLFLSSLIIFLSFSFMELMLQYNPQKLNLIGKIIDENKIAISNVLIYNEKYQINAKSDNNGYFSINFSSNENIISKLDFIKTGYSISQKLINFETNEQIFIEIVLLSCTQKTFKTSEKMNITINNSSLLINNTANFIYKNGSEYKGEVKIDLVYLNPTKINQLEAFPSFIGINQNKEEVLLESFGAVYFSVKDSYNNDLNFDNAFVQFDVTTSYHQDLSYWIYNEKIGKWEEIEKNVKVLRGRQYYVTKVTSGGWKNIDVGFTTNNMNGYIYNGNIPVGGAYVSSVGVNFNSISHGITNKNGMYTIKTKKDGVSSISVFTDSIKYSNINVIEANSDNTQKQNNIDIIDKKEGENNNNFIELRKDLTNKEEEKRKNEYVEKLKKKSEESIEKELTEITQLPEPIIPLPENPDFKQYDAGFLDVVFCLDTTSSMGPYLSEMISTVSNLILKIYEKLTTEKISIKFGLVEYRDNNRGDEFITRVTSQLVNKDEMLKVVKNIQAVGGGDTPEAVLEGLYESAVNINWRYSGQFPNLRYIIHVADAPIKQHSKTLDMVANEINSKKIRYKLIKCTNGNDLDAMGKSFKNKFNYYDDVLLSNSKDLQNNISKMLLEEMFSGP